MKIGALVVVLLLPAFAGCLGGSNDQGEPFPELPEASSTEGTLTVAYTYKPTVPRVNQRVVFLDQSHDERFEIVSHAWDFGDGRSNTEENPTHAFLTPGRYTVTLRVRNSGDVEASVSRNISVTVSPTNAGQPTDPGTPPAPEGDEYLHFGAPVPIQGNDGGEPSLAIDPGGKIYVNPISRLYRSDDGGASFRATAYPPTVISGDSHIVADKDGLLWVSDLGGVTVPVYGSITVWTSSDDGASWSKGNVAASDTVQVDRQWLAAPGGGVGYLLYRQCAVADMVSGVCVSLGTMMTKSIDAGLTWTPLGRQFAWTAFPFVNQDDGTLYVVQATDNRIDVAVSRDGGLGFTQVRVANRATSTENLFVHGAVDDAGNAYVVWVDRDSKQNDVWMSYSTSQGTKWSKPFQVSSGVGTNIFPWLAAGGDGKVGVAWYATPTVGEPHTVGGDARWHVASAVSTNAHNETPVFAQSPATGTVHHGSICISGAACGEADRDLLDFLSTGVTPDGRFAVAFGEDGGGSTTRTMFVIQDGGPPMR